MTQAELFPLEISTLSPRVAAWCARHRAELVAAPGELERGTLLLAARGHEKGSAVIVVEEEGCRSFYDDSPWDTFYRVRYGKLTEVCTSEPVRAGGQFGALEEALAFAARYLSRRLSKKGDPCFLCGRGIAVQEWRHHHTKEVLGVVEYCIHCHSSRPAVT